MSGEETEKKLPRQFRRCRFTWNNYTSEEVQTLEQVTSDKVDYIVFGFEIAPSTGTPHLQGYAEFSKLMSLKQAKEILDPVQGLASKVSLLGCQSNAVANKLYCMKAESKDPEWAEYLGNSGYIEIIHKAKTRGQGRGADADKMMNLFRLQEEGRKAIALESGLEIVETAIESKTILEFCEKNPMEFLKYGTNVEKLMAAGARERSLAELKEKLPQNLRLRRWQRYLFRELMSPPPDAKVIWYVCKKGRSGKSTFTKWLKLWYEAISFNNGKTGDIVFGWNGERIVIFDLPRPADGHTNMTVIETINNGDAYSTKYASCNKLFNTPWVVVFSNMEPDLPTMSAHKWVVRHLYEDRDCGLEPNDDGLLFDYVETPMPSFDAFDWDTEKPTYSPRKEVQEASESTASAWGIPPLRRPAEVRVEGVYRR